MTAEEKKKIESTDLRNPKDQIIRDYEKMERHFKKYGRKAKDLKFEKVPQLKF